MNKDAGKKNQNGDFFSMLVGLDAVGRNMVDEHSALAISMLSSVKKDIARGTIEKTYGKVDELVVINATMKERIASNRKAIESSERFFPEERQKLKVAMFKDNLTEYEDCLEFVSTLIDAVMLEVETAKAAWVGGKA